MLRRSCHQSVCYLFWNDCITSTSRSAVHTSGVQMLKKKTDPTSPKSGKAKDKKVETKTSNQEASYPSGKEFFSHTMYSYYDIENDMEKDRIEQPSAKP